MAATAGASSPVTFTNVSQVDSRTYSFRLAPTHVAYANTLRRLIMTGVETVAFRADMTSKGTTSDVDVRANDTPMTNEMFAHRIGLIPIHIKEPLSWNPEKYNFTLKVTADKVKVRDVTCSDFVVTEVVSTEADPVVVPTERFFPPHPITKDTCLLAVLPPGTGKIDIVAKATIGTGRENARFQPTCRCTYEYTRDIDEARREAYFRKWLAEAKKVNPDSLEKDSERYKAFVREFNTMEVARVYLQTERGEPYSFDFTVESVGVLEVPYIVQRACEVGEAMVGRYVNLDKAGSAVPDELTISPSISRLLGFDFLFRGHDHTLGNLIQTWLSENHMEPAGGSGLTKITYAGYEVPHPLRDEMVVRIGVEDGSEATARAALSQTCQNIANMFRVMRSAWLRGLGGGEGAGAGAGAGTSVVKRVIRRPLGAGAGAGAAVPAP